MGERPRSSVEGRVGRTSGGSFVESFGVFNALEECRSMLHWRSHYGRGEAWGTSQDGKRVDEHTSSGRYRH